MSQFPAKATHHKAATTKHFSAQPKLSHIHTFPISQPTQSTCPHINHPLPSQAIFISFSHKPRAQAQEHHCLSKQSKAKAKPLPPLLTIHSHHNTNREHKAKHHRCRPKEQATTKNRRRSPERTPRRRRGPERPARTSEEHITITALPSPKPTKSGKLPFPSPLSICPSEPPHMSQTKHK